MKARQVFWLVLLALAFLTTWLLVWREHYLPSVAAILVAGVSAWRTGWID